MGPLSVVVIILLAMYVNSQDDSGWGVLSFLFYSVPVVILCCSVSVLYLISWFLSRFPKTASWNKPSFYIILFCSIFIPCVYYILVRKNDHVIGYYMRPIPFALIAAFTCNYFMKSRYKAIAASILLTGLLMAAWSLLLLAIHLRTPHFSVVMYNFRFRMDHVMFMTPFSFPYCFAINNIFSLWKKREVKKQQDSA